MKAKISEILNVSSALQMVATKELPSKLSYWLSRLDSKTSKIVESFNKERNKLLQTYGKADKEKPNSFTFTDEDRDKFNEEVMIIANEEEEITIDPIPLSLFDNQLLSKDFFVLMGNFIKE